MTKLRRKNRISCRHERLLPGSTRRTQDPPARGQSRRDSRCRAARRRHAKAPALCRCARLPPKQDMRRPRSTSISATVPSWSWRSLPKISDRSSGRCANLGGTQAGAARAMLESLKGSGALPAAVGDAGSGRRAGRGRAAVHGQADRGLDRAVGSGRPRAPQHPRRPGRRCAAGCLRSSGSLCSPAPAG